MTQAVLLWLAGFFLGGLGAWVVSRSAGRFGLIDTPNERSSHSTPTPRGGGVGLLAAFLLSALVGGVPVTFWLPLGVLALFAFLGDRIDLSPKWRMPTQVILMGILVVESRQLGPIGGGPSVLLYIFWIIFMVGTANFFNFMDGINGIAGITGACALALSAWLIYNLEGPNPYFIITVGVALACLGFLPFNMPSARVFMGDVGSIFLGGLFGGLVCIHSLTLVDFLCMASFLFPFYADELTTMAVRVKDRENLIRPHRRHLYQLLTNEKHMPHWKVSALYGLIQLVVGLSILFFRSAGWIPVLLLLGIYFTAFAATGYYVRSSLAPRSAG